jgi:pyruvate,water dikinase
VIGLRDAQDAGRFGGKAAQLATALSAGLPVPDGLALDVELVHRVASGETAAMERCAAQLASLGARVVAVRSSAIGEDGAGASFAGQHLTRLGVRSAAGLFEAIRDVWSSARAPGALAYRQRLGLEGAPRIAVVVQEMVQAERAGVMFTADPRTGEDVRVIEAAWGLGEAIVSGIVDPDRYRVRRGGVIAERAIGDKDVAVRMADDGGTEEHAVPDAMRRRACLDDEALRALDALATRCDDVYGAVPHDVEFAWGGARLFLLQRRPITR